MIVLSEKYLHYECSNRETFCYSSVYTFCIVYGVSEGLISKPEMYKQ